MEDRKRTGSRFNDQTTLVAMATLSIGCHDDPTPSEGASLKPTDARLLGGWFFIDLWLVEFSLFGSDPACSVLGLLSFFFLHRWYRVFSTFHENAKSTGFRSPFSSDTFLQQLNLNSFSFLFFFLLNASISSRFVV